MFDNLKQGLRIGYKKPGMIVDLLEFDTKLILSKSLINNIRTPYTFRNIDALYKGPYNIFIFSDGNRTGANGFINFYKNKFDFTEFIQGIEEIRLSYKHPQFKKDKIRLFP